MRHGGEDSIVGRFCCQDLIAQREGLFDLLQPDERQCLEGLVERQMNGDNDDGAA